MTAITHTGFTTTSRIDSLFVAVAGFCADFYAGVRDGGEIYDRYRTLSQRSTHDLDRLGLARAEVARAALTGWPH